MSPRLDLLKPLLAQYKRRFTVLDLGSGIEPSQNIGQEIARTYDAVCVSVEKNWSAASFAESPRTIVLKREVSVEDLRVLQECEHFDVVLAFNILHWFGSQAVEAADIIRRMGTHVFVQFPRLDDTSAIGQDTLKPLHDWIKWSRWNWCFLGETVQFPTHMPRPVWLFTAMGRRRLTRTAIGAHPGSADTVIQSGFYACRGKLNKSELFNDWIPGINLWNFCQLGGVVPSTEQIQAMLHDLPLPEVKHGDIQPWNMILDGERLHLIDGGDEWGGDDQEGLEGSIRKVVECLQD